MPRPLTDRERRIGAWLLLAALVATLYGVIIEPLFVAPWQQVEQQIQTLAEQRRQYQQMLARRDLAQQDGPAEVLDGKLLRGDDPSAVAAELMQSVARSAAQNAQRGAGCQLTQRMPIIAQAPSGPFQQVSVSLDLECATEPLAVLLHQLESAEPWLFVDELIIRRTGDTSAQGGAGRLGVHMLVSGFLAAEAQMGPAESSQETEP